MRGPLWISPSPVALFAAIVFVVGCKDEVQDCEERDLFECSDGACHECCTDAHCSEEEICSESKHCEIACLQEGEECAHDRGGCCEGLTCDTVYSYECVDVECETDADCTNWDECLDGICVELADHCFDDSDCLPCGKCFFYGFYGVCHYVHCEYLSSCQVVPESAVTQEGTQIAFSAAAFMTSGAMGPGVGFDWASNNDAIASVVGGVVTGGPDTGTAVITAFVNCCHVTCDASVQNYGAITTGARVVAVDELKGKPVEGVTVEIVGAAAPVVTDALGVAEFPDVDLFTAASTVTLSHEGYGYVSFVDANSNDLIAHLGEIPDPNVAGGYQGRFDYSRIFCEPGDGCEISLGLTGASIPGNLFNLNLDVLIGEMLMTHIELGGQSLDVPLPGGLEIGLNEIWFKEGYKATGVEGTRVAWGLGGKLNLSDVLDLVPLFTADPIDISAILAEVMPLFGKFNTAVIPNVEIDPISKVEDVNDINGNDDTTDLVPDYDNFPELPGGDMVLKVPMENTVTINVGALPPDGPDAWLYDSVIVLGGVLVRDAGLVPLGLTAGMDAPTSAVDPDGQIEPIQLTMSDVAGRLPEGSYQRVIVVLALNIGKLTAEDNTDPLVIAGQVHVVDDFSGTLDLNPLMGPVDYTFDPESANPRQVDLISVPAGIDYVLMLLSSEAGTWQVLHPGTTGLFDLPDAPVAGDRAAGMGIVALKLSGDVTYQDLIAFNGTNMSDMVALVSDFVISQ